MSRFLFLFILLFVPTSAFAECEEWYPSSIQWLASTNPHYTVCYTAAYRDDVSFVRRYLNSAKRWTPSFGQVFVTAKVESGS